MLSLRYGNDGNYWCNLILFLYLWVFSDLPSLTLLIICLMAIILVLLKFQRTCWTLHWWNSQYVQPRNGSLRYFQATELEEGRRGKPSQLKASIRHLVKPTWRIYTEMFRRVSWRRVGTSESFLESCNCPRNASDNAAPIMLIESSTDVRALPGANILWNTTRQTISV